MCRAGYIPEPGTRPPGRSASGQERAGRRNDRAGRPAGKGQGGGRLPPRRGDPDRRSKLGRDSLASVRNKVATGGREGAQPPSPAGAATAAAAPVPRPAAASGGARLPALRPGPRGRAERGEVPGPPPQSPGCSAARSSRSFTSPRHEWRHGPGSSSDSSARFAAAGCRGPRPPGAAHCPARCGRPPAEAPFAPTPAGLPSLSGTLRSRTRPRATTRPDSQPGKERRRAPASERGGQAGDTPLAALPGAHQPPAPRAPAARASRRPQAPAARAPTPTPRAWRAHPGRQ